MKRIGSIETKSGERMALYEAMADDKNIQIAYNKARKCKRYRKEVLIFTKDKEENLQKVRNDILRLTYEPSEYRYFKVYEPKERQIMALPFYGKVKVCTLPLIRCKRGFMGGTNTTQTSRCMRSRRTYTTISRALTMMY